MIGAVFIPVYVVILVLLMLNDWRCFHTCVCCDAGIVGVE